jgi:hypothetical protein
MSLSRALAALFVAIAAPLAYAQEAAGFGCPATIAVGESATIPPPWLAEAGAAKEHKFLRPSIYNGTPGGKEYELAPDDEKSEGKRVRQAWKLSEYREMNLFLRCRYAGTAVTAVADIPPVLKTCVFTFRNMPGNQPVASPSFECR